MIQQSHLGIYPKHMIAGSPRDNCNPMFFVALFTLVKIWKIPKCLLTYISHKKEGNPAMGNNMDGPGGHYTK